MSLNTLQFQPQAHITFHRQQALAQGSAHHPPGNSFHLLDFRGIHWSQQLLAHKETNQVTALALSSVFGGVAPPNVPKDIGAIET